MLENLKINILYHYTVTFQWHTVTFYSNILSNILTRQYYCWSGCLVLLATYLLFPELACLRGFIFLAWQHVVRYGGKLIVNCGNPVACFSIWREINRKLGKSLYRVLFTSFSATSCPEQFFKKIEINLCNPVNFP